MDLAKQFGTGETSETGAWVDLGDGAKIKIARMNNKVYKDAVKRLSQPYRAAIRANALSDEKAEEIMTESLADGVVLGWEGFQLNGVELEYNKENVMKVLIDPALVDFRNMVIDMAGDADTFKTVEDAEDVKP